jgi:hypothetical protein
MEDGATVRKFGVAEQDLSCLRACTREGEKTKKYM